MKKSLILLVLLFSVFMFVGCKQNVRVTDNFKVLSVEEIANKDITIKFVVRSGVISTALVDLVTEFKERYPKITVDVEALSGSYDLIRSTTMIDINSKQAPDLVIGYPDHFAEYYSAGALVNLTRFIEDKKVGFTEEEMSDFLETYLKENRGFNDEKPEYIYGLPFNKSTEVLVYNKTFFEKLYGETWQTKIPKTWQELETVGADIVTRVRNKEADNIFVQSIDPKTQVKTYLKVSDYLATGKFIPLGYDSADNAFITLTRQFGAEYTKRIDVEHGYVRFNNQQSKDAMAYFKGLKDNGIFGTSALYGLDYMSDAFKLIQSVMSVGSSAGVGYNASAGFAYELGVAPIPYYSADKKYVIQQGTNIAMLNQNSDEEKLAAWLFIKFLMEPEKSAQFAIATGGYFPVRKSAYETAKYTEYLTNPTDDKVHYSKAANVVLNDYIEQEYIYFVDDAFVGSAAIRNEAGAIFNDIMVNNKVIEARINEAYKTLKPYVEAGK
ncbi:MAG TPA: extracellular solute-binding protein [Bacilli bacterium]|nr:MAG: sn-glycerol-3-phosphate-binding periplasmic protein UgpB precursor [Tenericutes bacterium ADurb.BinA124]HNZ50064.1 extracellular solute-binding protein [Bacilli bacterium]HPX84815.1 extracellular solute-binding protein [Bacilli bacterium]HQC74219.1 extracellular solute-binding protein [Bacilli bacterium]